MVTELRAPLLEKRGRLHADGSSKDIRNLDAIDGYDCCQKRQDMEDL